VKVSLAQNLALRLSLRFLEASVMGQPISSKSPMGIESLRPFPIGFGVGCLVYLFGLCLDAKG